MILHRKVIRSDVSSPENAGEFFARIILRWIILRSKRIPGGGKFFAQMILRWIILRFDISSLRKFTAGDFLRTADSSLQ
jgi:hypothetical protein